MNKGQERFFVEEAARLLGVEWELVEDRESPDFLIDDGSCRFGLEVSELFAGPVGIKGAARKIAESINQKKIDRCRRAYEKERDMPLDVAILGQVTRETMEKLLTEILARDLAAMEPGERFEVVDKRAIQGPRNAGIPSSMVPGERRCRLGEHQSGAGDRQGRGKEIQTPAQVP